MEMEMEVVKDSAFASGSLAVIDLNRPMLMCDLPPEQVLPVCFIVLSTREKGLVLLLQHKIVSTPAHAEMYEAAIFLTTSV